MRFPFAVCVLALFVPLAAAVFVPRRAVPATALAVPVADAFSNAVTLRDRADDWYVGPIHLNLLPGGRLLITGVKRPQASPTATDERERISFVMDVPPPERRLDSPLAVDAILEPVDANSVVNPPYLFSDFYFCAGHTHLADGNVVYAGGARIAVDLGDPAIIRIFGLNYGATFDVAGERFTRIAQDMAGTATLPAALRYYPTLIRLDTGEILVIGGIEEFPCPNRSVERWNPATGSFQLLSTHAASPPEIEQENYTHAWVLPRPLQGHDILMFGHAGVPVLHEPRSPARWQVRQASLRPGSAAGRNASVGVSSVLLPLRAMEGEWGYANGSVLMAGGERGEPQVTAIDVYDPVADVWRPTIDMGVARHHASTVLLPDGRILILAGDGVPRNHLQRRAQYVDPRSGFALRAGAATMSVIRGYHTVAALMPEGHVFVASGGIDDVAGFEKPNFEVYLPDYMFKPRPRIVRAPRRLRYGNRFRLEVESPTPIREVVLMGLASMTHSFDSNMRSVQLVIHSQGVTPAGRRFVEVKGPLSARWAPPGNYMVIALDDRLAPSPAAIVLVQ